MIRLFLYSKKDFSQVLLFSRRLKWRRIFKESKKNKLEKKVEDNKEEYVLDEKKRMLDDDEKAYKVLAMLLEPIVSEEFRMMNEAEKKDSVIPSFPTESKWDYRPRI